MGLNFGKISLDFQPERIEKARRKMYNLLCIGAEAYFIFEYRLAKTN